MTEPVYRLAGEEDLPAVAELYADLDTSFRQFRYAFPQVEDVGQVFVDSFRRTLGRFSIVFVAELGGRIVGFILGRVKRVAPYMGGVLVGEISDIYVNPDARGLHVGETLTRRALGWLREQDVHSVETQILEGNEPSLRMFSKLGFHPELTQSRLSWEDYDRYAQSE